MNTRERFLASMNFERVDRPLLWEFGYWSETITNWYSEGMPGASPPRGPHDIQGYQYETTVVGEVQPWPMRDCLKDREVNEFFDLDTGAARVDVNEWIYPEFEVEVLEENETTQVIIDSWGVKKKISKKGNTLPKPMDWPIKNRKDFEKFKEERLDPNNDGRFPDNWEEVAKGYSDHSYPLSIGGYPVGFFGALRWLIGDENLLKDYYRNPEFIKDILQYLTDMWIQIWSEVLDKVEVDFALFWEDMAYKKGSFISPNMFREFLTPYYNKIHDFLKGHGVNVSIVDTDGDIWELIPLFQEAGVTGIYPFEVQAGMNICEVREKFPDLQIIGGLNKEKIAEGKDAIDEELEKATELCKKSGFIACADHNIPPHVSWDNFKYYRNRLNDIVAGQ